MRLAMVGSEKLPIPPIRGGAVQTYIQEVARLLAPRHEITLVGVCDDALPLEEVRGGIRYIRIKCRPNDPMSYARGLVQRMSRERFDVIEVFNRPLNVLPLHKACPGSRFVLSPHNEMFRESKIPRGLALATLEVLERIVTVSQYIADSVTVRYPQAAPKVRTLYSGVRVEDYKLKGSPEAKAMAAATRRELGLKDGPVILYVGRLSRSKGPDRLIAAFPNVLRRFPNANLVLVGGRWFGVDEPDEYVRELWQSAEPVREHIFFTGYVPHNKLNRYFAAADVFVCTSQWDEPLARVHYEAMASGLPVITTDRGGNAEIVQTGVQGIVLEEWDDPVVFAANILSILENPKRAQAMGLAGRRLVERFFTWTRVARDLEKVLTEAAAAPPRPIRPAVNLDDGILQKRGQPPAHLLRGEMLSDTLRKVRTRSYHTLSLLGLARPAASPATPAGAGASAAKAPVVQMPVPKAPAARTKPALKAEPATRAAAVPAPTKEEPKKAAVKKGAKVKTSAKAAPRKAVKKKAKAKKKVAKKRKR